MKKTLSNRIEAMQQRMATNTAVARSRAYQASARKREEASAEPASEAPAEAERPVVAAPPAAATDYGSDQTARRPRASARKPR